MPKLAQQTQTRRNRLGPCLLLAAVLVSSFLFFSPGISMTDTLSRWAGAYTIIGKLDIPWALEQWLAPTMTWFMVPFAVAEFGGPYFHAAQVAYLLLGATSWAYFTSSDHPWWVAVPFMLPLVFVYSSFIVPDVWTLASILAIVGSLYALEKSARVLPLIVFPISCVVLFGFRQNSLVLVPIVWFFVAKLQTHSVPLKTALIAMTIGALCIIGLAPPAIGFNGTDSSAAAPAWELVGAIKVARENGVEPDPALSLAGVADTDKAVEKHSFVTIDSMIWGADAAIPGSAIMTHADEIKSRWLKMVFAHPAVYLETKLRIYKCMLGLCSGYLQILVGCEPPPAFLRGNLQTCEPGSPAANALILWNNAPAILRYVLLPAFWLPLSAVAIFFGWRRYSRHDRMLIVLATAYLSSFFLLNQAASFRYLFPTYVVFTAYQVRFLFSLPAMARRFKARSAYPE